MGVASLDLQQTDVGQGKIDYGNIKNKPMINGVTLEGDLSTEDINIFIPQRVSELQNDAGYITKNVNDLVYYYDKTEVDNMISTIPKFDIKVVDALPTEDISPTTIYLLMVEGEDHFEEYIYVDDEWDKLGDGNIDLSDYATYEYVNAELAEKVDAADLATVALSGRYSDLIGTPTNLSQFTNDTGFITAAALPTKTSDLTNDGEDGTSTYVESNELATVATSGSYNDLTDKPTIDFELVEMSYGESNAWAKFIAAYQGKKIVYCRASSNSNPATGAQNRKAFMAYVNDATNPTEVEFQYVRSVSSKTSSQPVDQVFVYKLTSASGGTWTVQTRDMGPKLAQGTNTTVSYSSGTYTISASQPTVNDATLTIQKNGTTVETFTANSSTNKTANIVVPTKTSDITNDSDFVNSTQVGTALAAYTYPSQDLYTQSDIDTMLAQISSLKIEVVNALPQTGNADTIYLLRVRQQGNDIYQEYFWVNNAWELIGGIDLTDYYTKTEVNTLLTAKADVSAIPTKTSDLTNDSNFAVDANYVHTDNNYTTAEKNKLAGIAAGAEVNVQSNWTQADSSADDFIKNKPSIPTKTSDLTNDSGFITTAAIPTNVSAFNNDVGYLDEIPDDSVGLNQLDDTIVNALNNINNKANTADLAAVAFSGDYDDLTDKPTIPAAQVNSDWDASSGVAQILNKPTLATVATSGSYNDLSNKPTIPTVNNATLTIQKNGTDVQTFTANASSNKTANITVPTATSELTNDSNFVTSTDYASANDAGVVKVGAGLAISSGGVLSATGGGTADAVAWGHITGTMADQTDLTTALAAKANSADLATVATSGDYDDLTDKPTIGNATLTIQKNGTSAGTFTANATSNKTINITVPTTAADVSALPASTKYGASIAVSINTTDYKVTTTLKDQDGNTLGTAQVIDLPLESVVVNGSYDNTNKKIVLTLQNGNTIDIPVADLVAGLQSEITSTNKLASDLVDDTNQTNKFMTSAEKTKLSGIAAGAEVNVQSDWNQTTNTADDYIKNKPSLAAVATSGAYSDLSGTPSLATVATSGSYNDLSNKPTIPTVNNATLTIQKNGTNVQTFTANQSTNATADIVTDELQRKSDTRSSMLPSDANYPAKGTLHFTTIGALDTQTQSGGYADAFLMNSWNNDSGGRVNAIVATKQNDQKLYHYTGTFNGSSWSGKKEIAYTDAIPTKVSDLTNDSGFITSSGTAAKANQLTTARTIALGTGATGTATSFNGTSDITIPVTNVKDAYVTWGGKSLAATVSPDDMGCIDEFGHNKLAFLPAECIEVKYSTDGGSTWVDYGMSDANKVKLVSTTGAAIYVGGPTDNATSSNITNLKARVRIACGPTTGGKLYTAARKLLINMSTQGASGCKVDIRYRSIANYIAGTETWTTVGTYDVAGGSGWNSIPFNYTWGGSFTTQTSQIGQFEFVLYCAGLGTWGYKKPDFIDFRLIGATNWSMPSEMARAGHLYTVDENQNAFFPATVSVAGSLKHGSYTYTLPNKTGTVAMTSDLPTVNNATLTIQKNGTNVQTFTANQSTNATANITVPTATSDLTNDSGFLTSIPTASASTLGGIKVGSGLSISNGVLSTNATAPDWSDITNKPTFATVATSGSYNDLSNKPTIPAAQVNSDWNASSGVAQILNKPTLATVATSGSYNDLSNKPTIPTVNNGTLTIQKNGTNVATFTANQSSGSTANITVPTTVSELSDASSYATLSDVSGKQDALTAGDHIDITNDVISATDYVHSENPVSTTAVTPIVTGSMISNGTITADKLATGATVQLTLSTTDIGEGAALAANTLYGVYQ